MLELKGILEPSHAFAHFADEEAETQKLSVAKPKAVCVDPLCEGQCRGRKRAKRGSCGTRHEKAVAVN